MKPNNHEERVCPRCGEKMRQQKKGKYKCTSCGFEASEDALDSGREDEL